VKQISDGKLHEVGYIGWWKKLDDKFSRLSTILCSDRQTDGQTSH